jgi:prepilin-type N-terminal cleavage/methylation domain-containing protein
MIIKYLHRLKKKSGFTLVELITVLAIMGVLATVTIPVATTFVQRGMQTNRTNIARNIFVLVQSHLTRSYLERTLKETLTGHNYEISMSGAFTDTFDMDVYEDNSVMLHLLAGGGPVPGEFPDEEVALGNGLNVRFVSKPRNYNPATDCTGCPGDDCIDAQHLFFNMLWFLVLDRDLLQEAILMEYNIKTGNVLSIFYGNAEQQEFTYDFDDDEDENEHSLITGPRGDAYNHIAVERRQGFFGVTDTGVPTHVTAETRDVAHIRDGSKDALPVEPRSGTTDTHYKENVLYAEFILGGTGSYTFELTDDPTANPPTHLLSIEVDLGGIAFDYFYDAVESADPFGISNSIVYIDVDRDDVCAEVRCPEGDPPVCSGFCADFNRYIWIIDYIGKGAVESMELPYMNRVRSEITDPVDVYARAVRNDDVSVTSSSFENTLFERELSPGSFGIKSVRHLNNIRYVLCNHYDDDCECTTYHFRQTGDIHFAPDSEGNKVDIFEPLGVFRGSYRAFSVSGGSTPYEIKDLRIPEGDIVGLFTENRGFIDGLVLSGAKITGASGGALAGGNHGIISRVSVTGYPVSGEMVTTTVSMDGAYAGGIVGINYPGALIRDCTVRNSVVTGSAASAGGIAGRNYAAYPRDEDGNVLMIGADVGIQRVAVEYSTVAGAVNIGGVAGLNTGDIIDVYFLSTTRATSAPPVSAGGGGIAGDNLYGMVLRAFYIASAPRIDCPAPLSAIYYDRLNIYGCNSNYLVNCRYHLYPITYSGESDGSFYLAGRNYSIIGDGVSSPEGFNYNMSADDEFSVYNISSSYGLTKDFFSDTWIESVTGERLTNWRRPVTSYPYPVLRTLHEPSARPEAGGTTSIDVVFQEVSDPLRRMTLNFINGDFNSPLVVPADRASGTSANPRDTLTAGTQIPFNNATGPNVWSGGNTPAFLKSGWHQGSETVDPPVANQDVRTRRSTGAFNTAIGNVVGTGPEISGTGSTPRTFYSYFHQDFVPGWAARPFDPNSASQGIGTRDATWFLGADGAAQGYKWEAFEFQKPQTGGDAGRARRNYNGSMTEAYAELNADITSTIYQVCRTENYPNYDRGQQFYYTFHHQTRMRNNDVVRDDMSFFLTTFTPGTNNELDGRPHAGYGNLTLIRPCRSPRSAATGTDPAGGGTVPATNTNRHSRWYNPGATNTVTYPPTFGGRALNVSLHPYWNDKPQFETVSWGSDIYVYDVWIGGVGSGTGLRPASGYGVTFWSHTRFRPTGACTHTATTVCNPGTSGCNRNNGTADVGSRLCNHTGNCRPTVTGCFSVGLCTHGATDCRRDRDGCIQRTTAPAVTGLNRDGYANLGALATAVGLTQTQLEQRIFGYWGVEFGWKQYYGLYTVPHGQIHTEFAFQSNNQAQAQEANYLAGIDFASAPSYLTITTDMLKVDNPAAVISPTNPKTTASSVKPGDVLVIEHVVTNEGQTPAGTIVVENWYSHFNRLMDYTGNVFITGRRADGTPFTVATPPITPPTAANDYTLGFNFPNSFVLERGESITIQYSIGVRNTLREEDGTDTWLFFIRNQARVGYTDNFRQFRNFTTPESTPTPRCDDCFPVRFAVYNYATPGICPRVACKWIWNVSTVARVDISHVNLTKSVTPHPDAVPHPSGLNINGPFLVTLTITNSAEGSPTRGVIADTIPPGFSISNLTGAPRGFTRTINNEGIRQEQIIIHGIDLDAPGVHTITYRLTSTAINDRRYGISFASAARYLYGSAEGRADVHFPQQIVGLTIKADDLTFNANGTSTINPIVQNGLNLLTTIMRDDDYNVPTAEVVLTDEAGVPLPLAIGDIQVAMGTVGSARYRIELHGDLLSIEHDQPDPTNPDNPALRSNNTAYTVTIYYRLVSVATKTGGVTYDLSSPRREITVNFTPPTP